MAVNPNHKSSQQGLPFRFNDLGLMFKKSGLKGNSLSPFKKIFDNPPIGKESPGLNLIMNNPKLQQIPQSLFEPSLKLKINRVEFGEPTKGYYALFTVGGGFIVVIPSDFGENIHINFFNSSSFVDWLLQDDLPVTDKSYEPVFPGPMDMEILLVSLHSVDLYRRSVIESMLSYEPGFKLSMSTKTFLDYLTRGAKSSDVRWILPALFSLTPGLKNMSISLNQEHIKQAAELGFIIVDEDIITLGKKAVDAGTELSKSFPGLMGIQATHLVDNREFGLSQVFIATNITAGHLFSFEMPEPNRRVFNHQIFQGGDLKKIINTWVDTLIGKVKEKSSDAEVPAKGVPAGKSIPGNALFCRQCGAQLKTGAKFCAKCGTPIRRGGS